MANTISEIMPKILARGLLALREQASMPRLVNGSYSNEAAEQGDTIDIPVPSVIAAKDVTPSAVYSSVTDSAPSKVQVKLDNWKQADFYLTDKEMTEIDRNAHFIPMQMSEAIRALANVVNEQIFQEYKGIYGFTGTPGVTPFASSVVDATNARKVLHGQRAPRDMRRGVLDYDAEANALALSPFSDAEKVGGNDVKIEGEIGRKFGIDWYADDAVPTHTAGTISSPGGVVKTNAAVGASTLVIAANSGAGTYQINAGDIFTLAGDTQTYVVNATVSAIGSAGTSGQAISIEPPLKVAAASSTAMTVKGDHVVNLAFHRDAFAFANRPLQSAGLAAENIMSMTDPQTGITLRLEVVRQNKRTVWQLDILWGAKLVRRELAARIAG